MWCQEDKLRKIIYLGNEISQIKDIDPLLEKILREAQGLTSLAGSNI